MCTHGLNAADDEIIANGMTEKELKKYFKDLANQAIAEKQLWTLEQIYDYGESLELRSNKTFKTTQRIGTSLRGFPSRIRQLYDNGEFLYITAGDSIYKSAYDGMPLDTPIKLNHTPEAAALSFHQNWFSGIESWSDHDVGTLDIQVSFVNLKNKGINSRRLQYQTRGYVESSMAISDDGTHICFGINVSGNGQNSIIVMHRSGETREIENYHRAYFISNNGKYAVVRSQREQGRLFVIETDSRERQEVRRMIPGPNCAVVQYRKDDSWHLYSNGKPKQIRELETEGQIGYSAGKLNIAISDREQGQIYTDYDLFDQEINVNSDPKISVFKWSDLIDNASKAKPFKTFNGRFINSKNHANSGLVQSGKTISLLNLNNKDPELKTHIEFDQIPSSFYSREYYTIVYLPNNIIAYYDRIGRFCGSTPLYNTNYYHHGIRGPWNACYLHNNTYYIQILNPDESKRKLYTVGREWYEIELWPNAHNELWYGRNEENEWVRYRIDGTLFDKQSDEKPYPPARGSVYHYDGSAYRFGARFFLKENINAHLSEEMRQYSDACYSRAGFFTSTYDGDVYITRKKKNELLYESNVYNLELVSLNDTVFLRQSTMGGTYGAINSRKEFIPMRQPANTPNYSWPHGQWQVEGRRFRISRGDSIRWPRQLFNPVRLRSHEKHPSLLVVTNSLIYEFSERDMKNFLKYFEHE